MSSEKETPVAVGVLSLLRPNLLTQDQELLQGDLALGEIEAHVPEGDKASVWRRSSWRSSVSRSCSS